MNNSLTQFHQLQLRLRAIVRVSPSQKPEIERAIVVLQRYYDLQRLSPASVVDESLAAEALSIENKFALLHQDRLALQEKVFSAKTRALTEIGKHYGSLAKSDEERDVQSRFQRWWRCANQFRKSHLDGIALHGSTFDPDGPMFKAFMKAAGLRYEKNGRFSLVS